MRETTYHAATLIIYSHADKVRSEAIRASLESGVQGKSAAIARALRAAGAGRKMGRKLEARMIAPSLLGQGNSASRPGTADTDAETENYMTESEWEGPQSAAAALQNVKALPTNMPLWLPFALTLVSRFPIYDLMLDVLRISWARYHLSISDHSLSMTRFINTGVVEQGRTLRVPAAACVSAWTRPIAS